ncbi:MAG: thioredoxin family protein [Patescibacteria group bacterium]
MKIRRYIYTFVITLAIFFLSLWLSNVFGERKIQTLRDLENQISLNILSVETRFSLLQKTSCEHITNNKDDNAGFNKDLNDLALRVKSLENQLGYYNEDVMSLKKYYSLLQIKDYLLTKEYHERCKQDTVTVLYFHNVDCPECSKQSIILDKLVEEYPEIRVYYFDLTTNTPALDTLSSIYKIQQAPALVIDDKAHVGYQDIDQVKSFIPEIKVWDKEKLASSTAATSTATTSTKKTKIKN